MKKVAIVTMIILGGLMFFGRASALTIIPPRIEVAANPGQPVELTIKLYNETDKEQILYTSAANFSAEEDEEGIPKFYDLGNSEDGLAKWISIESGPITVNPMERKEIAFKINVPANADPGGHYAALFFSSQPASNINSGSGVGVTEKIGALILLRVSGDIQEAGKLVEFKLKNPQTFYDHLPVGLTLLFQNTGNVHLKPVGEVKITNLFGAVSEKIAVNKQIEGSGKNVLPNTSRHLEAVWTRGPLEVKANGFFDKVNAEINNFALGRYKATLNLEYGSLNKTAQASVFFWVFPWHLMLVVTAAAVILILIFVTTIKKYNKWIVKKALESSKSK